MTIRASAFWTLVAVAAGAACTVSQTTPSPGITAPSTFATSLQLTASPDLVTLGQSFSTPGESSLVLVKAFDETGQPKANQVVRLDMAVNGIIEDCGTLQVRNLTTDTTGQASTTFTAPGNPVPLPECTSFFPGSDVTILARPVGTDAQANGFSTATIRMVSPTFITPIGGLVVNFTISSNPKIAPAKVTFSDAGSTSPGHTIVSYAWSFSDGATKIGAVAEHDFTPAGPYTATLTITDDIGQSASKTVSFEVSP